jgi:broad specificity phosphatase PhoE
MTTFYICRHGETENNKNQLLSGWLDSPLTKRGIKNIQATILKLRGVKFDSIQHSDLGRAVATAKLLATGLGFNGNIVPSKALREVDYGDLAGLSYKEAANQFPQPDKAIDFTPSHGESLGDMQKRVIEFLKNLSKSSPELTILLSAHDGTIKAVYANFVGIDIGQHDANHEYPHDFVAKFIMSDGVITSFIEVS